MWAILRTATSAVKCKPDDRVGPLSMMVAEAGSGPVQEYKVPASDSGRSTVGIEAMGVDREPPVVGYPTVVCPVDYRVDGGSHRLAP